VVLSIAISIQELRLWDAAYKAVVEDLMEVMGLQR
jgi:hypothetical protein